MTQQQREQVRECVFLAEQTQSRVHDMVSLSNKTSLDVGRARQQQTQIQNDAKTMMKQHNRLMETLTPEQKMQMKNQMREMEHTQSQFNARLQKMDEELSQPNPNRQQIAQQAKEMEQTMNRWENQYKGMETDMEGGT